jgi:N-methylhydantoinase B
LVDFTGSSPQVAGAVNAVEAITVSAVSYCFRCLVGGDVPASAGLIEPIKVTAPEGTVVNARHPASVAGGNVETSQRIVDTVFKALSKAIPGRIPAASQGTMNNLTIGGIDPRTGSEFSYYETVAGGMGARAKLDGMSATHSHMTNSLNTPAELSSMRIPCGCANIEFAKGRAEKENRTVATARFAKLKRWGPRTWLCFRIVRKRAPYGLRGGQDGELGRAFVIRADGRKEELRSKDNRQLNAAIACASKRQAAAALEDESADYTDYADG